MPAQRIRPLPRQMLLNPSKKEYNRVIRLEGQIRTVKEIVSFYWFYDIPEDFLEISLVKAGGIYFSMIDELIDNFLGRGLDLAYRDRDLDGLIRILRHHYFRHFPEAEREKPYHWPKIFWMQKLQKILEDQNIDPSEALINGWRWFIDPKQYPSKFHDEVAVYSAIWAELGNARKKAFLARSFIDAKSLKAWESTIASAKSLFPNFQSESLALLQEFETLGVALDISHPEVTAPDSARHLGKCPVCRKQLKKEDIASIREHRPVQTRCGHVAGLSCFREWFQDNPNCPTCAADLRDSLPYFCLATAHELLESCDRLLRWLHPPIDFTNPKKPHSHMDKLCLIFEPAEEIRKRMWLWMPSADAILPELVGVQNLGIYVARERLAAVLANDPVRYQKAVLFQLHVGARRQWLQFLQDVLPMNSDSRWDEEPVSRAGVRVKDASTQTAT